jgi:hypothetical protein
MTSEPKCFHSAKWWRTCGRLVGFANLFAVPMADAALRWWAAVSIKCGNGLLCDLRTRSTEQWGQAEAGLNLLDEAIQTAEITNERLFEAELYRLRGARCS